MKILISNDDGWQALGIEALLEVASDFGDCSIIAPATEQSGVSHQMTLAGTMKLAPRSDQIWSLDGTPADCVRIGLTQLETQFDLVLSGINNGGNLGSDIYVSGTVAAAREAALFGLPAIAISQHRLRFGEEFDWGPAKQLAYKAIQHCLEAGLQERVVMNVNLPDMSDARSEIDCDIVDPCPIDPAPRDATFAAEELGNETHFRSIGKYNDRKLTPGHDVDCCFGKMISISRTRF